jgi:Flp pilus assembly pilin Flp
LFIFGITMAFRLVASKAMMSQFGRAHGGVIAVEFALVAVPLLAVLLFIVDMAANSITFRQMDVVGRSLATQMRSGSLDLSAHTAQSFRDQIVCPALPTLTCDQLIVSLASPSRLVNLSSADVAGPIWCAGGAGEALVFRLSYPVPFLMRIWAGGFAEQNPRYLVSFGLRNGPQAVAGAC